MLWKRILDTPIWPPKETSTVKYQNSTSGKILISMDGKSYLYKLLLSNSQTNPNARLPPGTESSRTDSNINQENPNITNPKDPPSTFINDPISQGPLQPEEDKLKPQEDPQLEIKQEYEALGDTSTGKEFKESAEKQKVDGIEEVKLQRASKKISKTILKNEVIGEKNWSKEEDSQLLQLTQEHGCNWVNISKLLGGTRTPREIRYRYINKVDPNIKKNSNWSPEEDEKLKNLFQMRGPKWRWISKLLPGRTEVMVKNRFYTKFKHLMETQSTEEQIQPDVAKRIAQKTYIAQETSRLKNLLAKTHAGQPRKASKDTVKASRMGSNNSPENPSKLQGADNTADGLMKTEPTEEKPSEME